MRVHPLLAVLACVLTVVAVKASQPGPLLGRDPDGFPASVVARVPSTPDVYRDSPRTRVLQLLGSMDTMWAGAFRAAGDDYDGPLIDEAAACRGGGGGAVGSYCPVDQHIVVDFSAEAAARAAGGDRAADDFLGYVLAHEVGHHVQFLRGAGQGDDPDVTLRRELQAECYAGVWGRAAGRGLPSPESYVADSEHGTVDQQRRWLERGYRRARPADCDGVWDASTPAARL